MEKDDPLWDLLGEAPTQEPSPWLEGRTLARVRREMQEENARDASSASVLRQWWFRLMGAGLCSTAAVVILAFFAFSSGENASTPGASAPLAAVTPTMTGDAGYTRTDLQEAFAMLADRGSDEVESLLDSTFSTGEQGIY